MSAGTADATSDRGRAEAGVGNVKELRMLACGMRHALHAPVPVMRHFLPTCPSWLRFMIAVWIGACLAMGAIGGEDKAGVDEESLPVEEAEDEVVKQLVFIEQHVAELLGLV